MIIVGKSKGDYPYAVAYSESKPATPIIISEGRGGQELIGAEISLVEAFSPKFRKYFTESGSEWFWDIIKKMQQTGLLKEAELAEIIRNENGA